MISFSVLDPAAIVQGETAARSFRNFAFASHFAPAQLADAIARSGLASFVARTGADELIIATQIFDHAKRLRSYETTGQLRATL